MQSQHTSVVVSAPDSATSFFLSLSVSSVWWPIFPLFLHPSATPIFPTSEAPCPPPPPLSVVLIGWGSPHHTLLLVHPFTLSVLIFLPFSIPMPPDLVALAGTIVVLVLAMVLICHLIQPITGHDTPTTHHTQSIVWRSLHPQSPHMHHHLALFVITMALCYEIVLSDLAAPLSSWPLTFHGLGIIFIVSSKAHLHKLLPPNSSLSPKHTH